MDAVPMANSRVLMQVPLPGGEALRLVHDSDDMLTIQRQGEILPGCFWRETEMHRAVSEFRRITRDLRDATNHNN